MSNLSAAVASANRGPLTSIFTPPTSCLDTTTIVTFPTTQVTSPSITITTTKIFINHFSWGDADCYPPLSTSSSSILWNNGFYYSPGICPSGWTSACSVSTHLWGFATNISSATSAVMCCPSSYSCVGGSTTLTAHGCSTFLASGMTLTSVWEALTPTPGVELSIPPDGSKSIVEWTVPKDTSAVCDAVPVMWQESDVGILSLLAVEATLTGASSSRTKSGAGATNIGSGSGFVPNSRTGLSTGVKAAIGVAIPIAFLVVLLGIFLFFRRRGQRLRRDHEELPVLDDSSKWKFWGKDDGPELDSSEIKEADASNFVAEMMDLEMEVHEMAGTEVPRELEGEVVKRKIADGMEGEELLRKLEAVVDESEVLSIGEGTKDPVAKSPSIVSPLSPLNPLKPDDVGEGMVAIDGVVMKGKGKEVVISPLKESTPEQEKKGWI